MTIADPEYTVAGSGDTRSLSIDYFRVDVTGDGETITVEFEDGCWKATAEGEEINSCELAEDTPRLEEMFDDPEQIQDLLAMLEETFEDYENPGFIVKQVDGQWYLSPFATGSEQLLAVLRALDRDEIDRLIEELPDAVEDAVGEDGVFDFDVEEEPRRPRAPCRCRRRRSQRMIRRPPPPSIRRVSASPSRRARRPAPASVSSSTPARSRPPWPRSMCSTPSAAWPRSYWSGEYTSLPDAEFVALVEETAPCFRAREIGELTEADLPLELSHPECLDGRNWFTAIEDQEFSDARVRVRLRLSGVRQGVVEDHVVDGAEQGDHLSIGVDHRERRLGGDLEALVDVAGVIAELRERESVLVDEALELVVAAVPRDADEVHLAGPPLCGRLDRGGFPVADHSIRRPEPEGDVPPGVGAQVEGASADGRRREGECGGGRGAGGAGGGGRGGESTRRRCPAQHPSRPRSPPMLPIAQTRHQATDRPYRARILRPVRTRTLLLLAVACGLVILAAGVVQLLRIAGQDEPAPAAVVGEQVQIGDLAVTVEDFAEDDGRAVVELELGGVDDPDGTEEFRLVVPGASLAPDYVGRRRVRRRRRSPGGPAR